MSKDIKEWLYEKEIKMLKEEVETLKNRDTLSQKLDNTFARNDKGHYMDYDILKKEHDELFYENTQLKEDFKKVVNDKADLFIEKEQLKEQNKQIKQELFNAYLHQQHQERLIEELKIALSSYNNFVDHMFPD